MNLSYDQAFPMALGRVISNLVQFEFGLRVALHLQEPAPMPTTVFRTLNVGDVLPENFLTNWHSLKDLIGIFNEREKARAGSTIDQGIVDLRDAFAHGRLTMRRDTGEYQLIRFSHPRGTGKVRVEMAETLTIQWFDDQLQRTVNATDIVWARIKQLKVSLGLP